MFRAGDTVEDFTKEEMRRLDIIYSNDMKTATLDDLELIIRWERAQAVREFTMSEQLRLMKEESAAKLEAAQRESDQAIANLNELHDAAIKRYEEMG